jgi:hypothetical protein
MECAEATNEYLKHLAEIKDDPKKLMAHIYVRHMGDLFGGQMIAKKVPSSGNFYTTWYQIPTFLIGLPLYSLDDCSTYIINKLNKDGFEANIIKPDIIIIKWTPPT